MIQPDEQQTKSSLSGFEKDLMLTAEIKIHPIPLIVARRVQDKADEKFSQRPEFLQGLRKIFSEFFINYATPSATTEEMREGVVRLLQNPEHDPSYVASASALIIDAVIAVEEASKRVHIAPI